MSPALPRTPCHCEALMRRGKSGLRYPAESSLDPASSLLADRCPLLRSLDSAPGSAPIAIRSPCLPLGGEGVAAPAVTDEVSPHQTGG